jgi:hypothetical protein
MKEFMRIEHDKLLRLIAVFLMGLTALITAEQVAAEINAPVPWNETDPLVTLNNAFREEYSRAKAEALSKIGPLSLSKAATLSSCETGREPKHRYSRRYIRS